MLELAIGVFLLLFGAFVALFVLRGVRERLRREEENRMRAELTVAQLRRLETLADALSAAQTVANVADVWLLNVPDAIGAVASAVAIAGGDTRLATVRGIGAGATASDISPALGALLDDAARRRTPTVDLINEDATGEFALPLVVFERVLGAVALNVPPPRILDRDAREFLVESARRTATAIERAQSYDEAERARMELEAYRTRADLELRERQKAEAALRESEARYRVLAARTSRLYSLSAGLSEAVTVSAVAKVVVRQGKIVAGASSGSVALLDGEAEFETLYSEEYPRQLVEAWRRFPAEPGLCATTALKTSEPVFISSFDEWQQHYPLSASMAADGGYASAAALPLLVEGAPIGILTFHFTAPVHFDDDYRALLTSIAHHAAQALDRARLYEGAQRARADAEAANQSKDEFLSIVSHELRTPLTAMLGWAAMLRSNALDAPRAPRAIEAIYSNATRQAHLIDELLDVSRIIAGRAPLDLQDVDLVHNLRGAVETILPQAEEKGVDVQMAPLPEAARLVADPHRLEQVFVNLLGNAVKFTPSGGRVFVTVEASDAAIDVRVADTGRGIDPVFLPHVFERFRQADSTVARSAGGLGLGLFITRCLVDAHGGRVSVESEGEGRGSTFTVSLPPVGAAASVGRGPAAVTRSAERQIPDEMPPLDGVRVLLVDDEADTREVMASVLSHCGATIFSASSGEEALDLLSREEGRVDVLLSDLAMPGTDGYELIRRVRRQPDVSVAGVPAAAVTACADIHERQRALAAGFQMHLAKPLIPEALAHAVASLAQMGRQAAESTTR
jgi:signal transduction histidine kinase/CheY-like chemotaxis protein